MTTPRMAPIENSPEDLSILELALLLAKRVMGHEYMKKIVILGIVLFGLYKLTERKKSLKDKLIVLTGASTGLGRAMAFILAKEKCRLAVWDLNAEALHKTVADIKAAVPGAEIFPYEINLVNREAIYDTASQVRRDHGPVWGLINNAGIIAGQTLVEEPDKKIEAVMNVNVMAHYWTCKAFLPDMLNNNDGHIVGVSSAAGLFPSARMVSYCASKHAARGFTEALRIEVNALGKSGVKVSGVYPAHIQTDLFKGYSMGTTMTPEYVASQIIDGMKSNRATIFLPWLPLFMGNMWQGILPVPLWDLFMLPTNSSLSNWKPDQANKLFTKMEETSKKH